MKREVGNVKYPIWGLGDSEPVNWRDVLDTPLDSRHPARHSILTAILDVIQEELFLRLKKRADFKSIFIRNAIDDPAIKPKENITGWKDMVHWKTLETEMNIYKDLCNQNTPTIVLCFGAFAYEFANRALNDKYEIKAFGTWGAKSMGKEFRNKISDFRIERVNLFPLLHASIARGQFMKSHEYFTGESNGNYFEYVGKNLARIVIENKDSLKMFL